MFVVAAVLRRRFVRKHFVESHVVLIDAVTCRTANDQIIRIAQVADQSSHGYVYNVIAKATAIGPTARNEPAVLKRILNVALQHVAAEDAQTRESGVVRVGWIIRTTTRKPRFVRRQVNLNDIGNVNGCDVGAIVFRSNGCVENELVYQARQLRRLGVLSKQLAVARWACAAVQILIGNRHQAFVKKWISLARNLHEWSIVLRLLLVVQHSYRSTARSCVNTGDLLVAAEFRDGHLERHQMQVESALRILARVAQLEQIEYRLDVGVEAVVALPGKRDITVRQFSYRFTRISIEFSLGRDAIARRVLAIVCLVVERRCVALVVRWNHTAAEQCFPVSAMVHFRDGVSLRQVLVRVANVLYDAEVRLKNRVLVFEVRNKAKLITQGCASSGHVGTERDVNLVENIVVEVVLVWSNSRLLVRVHAERED